MIWRSQRHSRIVWQTSVRVSYAVRLLTLANCLYRVLLFELVRSPNQISSNRKTQKFQRFCPSKLSVVRRTWMLERTESGKLCSISMKITSSTDSPFLNLVYFSLFASWNFRSFRTCLQRAIKKPNPLGTIIAVHRRIAPGLYDTTCIWRCLSRCVPAVIIVIVCLAMVYFSSSALIGLLDEFVKAFLEIF